MNLDIGRLASRWRLVMGLDRLATRRYVVTVVIVAVASSQLIHLFSH